MKGDYLLILALLCFTVCAGEEVFLLSHSEPNEFSVVEGEEFQIKIRGNITTGYTWTFDQSSSEKIKLVREEYIFDDAVDTSDKTKPVGRGGFHFITLKAKLKGTEKIKFVNEREWEKEKNGGKTEEVTINILGLDN